jgi:hypothetical protein
MIYGVILIIMKKRCHINISGYVLYFLQSTHLVCQVVAGDKIGYDLDILTRA